MAGANLSNYLSNQNSSFFSLEDVDEDEFLKNSRVPSTYRNQSKQYNGYNRGNGSFEDKKLQLMQQKQRIENDSLESTERSLRYLKESEDIGISTAEELQKQREQLERTDRNLDNINSTLRYTHKKIEGFKSVFGSIKNYLTKKSDSPIAGVSKDNSASGASRNSICSDIKESPLSEDIHPALKLRGLQSNSNDFLSVNDRIDHNLDQICLSVKNIKGLAINLGEEIDSQNELMDRIIDKADKADITLHKQNKEINKLLKK